MDRSRTLVVAAVVMFVALVALTIAVQANTTMMLDRSVTLAVQTAHPSFWDTVMGIVSWPGYPPQTFFVYGGWILIVILLWRIRGFIEGAIGLGGTALTGEAFKWLLNRPRPDGSGIFVAQRGLEGGTFSFPAGHVEAMTVVGLLTLWMIDQTVRNKTLVWVLRIIVVVIIILMGISRIYLGEHWFTDVVAGYLIGLVWTCITIAISMRWLSKRWSYGDRQSIVKASSG